MFADMSRRGFVGSMGMAAAASLAVAKVTAYAGEETKDEAAEVSPYDAMSNSEALELLLQEAEITGDLTLDDGTVIPAIYVRVRNHLNRVGGGLGDEIDTSANYWAYVMTIFSEDEAELYCEMPLTHYFTANELAMGTGRSKDECLAKCEELASRGILYRVKRAGDTFFRLIPCINGTWEFSIGVWSDNKDTEFDAEHLTNLFTSFGPDYGLDMHDSNQPVLRVLPASLDIFAEGTEPTPMDDFEQIIRSHELIAQAECPCRATDKAWGITYDESWRPKDTEILTGEMAQYYIDNGIGWQITQDEAIELLHHSVDMGLVIETSFSRGSEIFCQCEGKCCRNLTGVKATGGMLDAIKRQSPFAIKYDQEACLKCGLCITRCHLDAISYDEDGYAVTGPTCVRCGQCCVTCPGEARKLERVIAFEDYDFPIDLPESDLQKALNRIKKGYVTDFVC